MSFDVRCEWGDNGLRELLPGTDVVIIIDIFSFTTSVDVAVSRGVEVFPYRWGEHTEAAAFADEIRAVLATPRAGDGPSLSPSSLLDLEPGARLVLPSRNGSALSLLTDGRPTFAGCLRNARAVAEAAAAVGRRIAVIPAGERWPGDGSLRPGLEDWLGAGAVVGHLHGTLSPEARAARQAYRDVEDNLRATLETTSSGRELTAIGFGDDIAVAAGLNVSSAAPALADRSYVDAATRSGGPCRGPKEGS